MKRIAVLLARAMLVAACNLSIAGKQIAGMGPSYRVQAEFPTTIGLYPGSFVRQLGINVGQVSDVKNQGDHVLVTMKILDKYHLRVDAHAILVGDSVLGERYVQFEPAYVGGPAMVKDTVLGPDRVTIPVETDAVLRSLNTVLRAVNPNDIRSFTTNLASILSGQGQKLNALIQNAAGTVQLLADKGNQLGQLTTTLAQLTGQLSTKDTALANLIRDYDLLAQTIAADRSQIDGTITQLSNLTTQGAALLAPNLGPLQQDIADLATAGQTLDRNIPAVDIGLTYAPRLFSAAKRAYDPLHNWLPLNSQSNPRELSAQLGASIRDALASLCRRLGAKQPALAPALAVCGNPASGFFDPIIGLLPTLLGAIPGQSAPAASADDAFTRGLNAIPGLTPQQRAALTVPTPPSPQPTGAQAVAALEATPLPAIARPKHHSRGLFSWLAGLL